MVVLQILRSICSTTLPFSIVINLSTYLDSLITQTISSYSFPTLFPNIFADLKVWFNVMLSISVAFATFWASMVEDTICSITHLTDGRLYRDGFLVLIQLLSEYTSLNVPKTQALQPEWSWEALFPQASEWPRGPRSQTVSVGVLCIL